MVCDLLLLLMMSSGLQYSASSIPSLAASYEQHAAEVPSWRLVQSGKTRRSNRSGERMRSVLHDDTCSWLTLLQQLRHILGRSTRVHVYASPG